MLALNEEREGTVLLKSIWLLFFVFLPGCTFFDLPESNYTAELIEAAPPSFNEKFIRSFSSETGMVLAWETAPKGNKQTFGGGSDGIAHFEYPGNNDCKATADFIYYIENQRYNFRVNYYQGGKDCGRGMEEVGVRLFKSIYGVDMDEFTRKGGLFGP